MVPPQLPSGDTVAALGTGLGAAAARPASARVARHVLNSMVKRSE